MRKQRSAGVSPVLGLAACVTLAACGANTEAPETPEAVPLAASARELATGPDFIVTAVTGPTSVQPGQPFSPSVRTCNQGTAPGQARVELYLSPDAIITPPGPDPTVPSDSPMGSVYASLQPGECQTQQLPPGSIGLEGTFYLGAAADPFKELAESNENNNLKLGSRISIGNRPDFVVTGVTAPANVRPGQSFTASVTMCNQGTQPGSAPLELFLSQDTVIVPPVPPSTSTDVFAGYVNVSWLEPGQCRTESVQATANVPTEGTWYPGAVMNPQRNTTELLYDNNTRAGARMGVGLRPDFVVTAVTAPNSALPGSPLNVTATVCNQGTQPGSASVDWYLSQDTVITPSPSNTPPPDLLLGNAGPVVLESGQCQTLTKSVSPSGALEGAWYVGAVAGSLGGTPELFADNNARAATASASARGPTSWWRPSPAPRACSQEAPSAPRCGCATRARSRARPTCRCTCPRTPPSPCPRRQALRARTFPWAWGTSACSVRASAAR